MSTETNSNSMNPAMSPQPQPSTRPRKIWRRCLFYCYIVATLILFVVFLIESPNAPPNPSMSLLSLTTTGTSFTFQNITALFSISSRNKSPVIYFDFQVTATQYGLNSKNSSELTPTPVAASIQSLEQSGLSTDSITFHMLNSTVVTDSWVTVQNNNNESIRTGFSTLEFTVNLNARYARRRFTIGFYANCDGGQESHGHALTAEIVVNSSKDSPEINFRTDVFECLVSNDWETIVVLTYAWLTIFIILLLSRFCC